MDRFVSLAMTEAVAMTEERLAITEAVVIIENHILNKFTLFKHIY